MPCERIQQSCNLDSDTVLADAQRWMSDKGELAKESCDMNAKLCWALIVGQCNKTFVDIPFFLILNHPLFKVFSPYGPVLY